MTITRRIIIRHVFMLGFVALIMAVCSNSRPVAAQACDTVTDKQIVSSILKKIKADKTLATQMTHINIQSINKAVKIQGWVNTQKDFDNVVGIATNTPCARVVNVNDFAVGQPPATKQMVGCPSGTKPCGDICIPDGDSCNDAGSQ